MGNSVPYRLLQRLDQLLEQLARAVENALSLSLNVIELDEQGLAYEVIAANYRTLSIKTEVDTYTAHLLSLEQPWSAHNIHIIITTRVIANHFLHIGECATSIAKSTLHMPFTYQQDERFRRCLLNRQQTISEQKIVDYLLELSAETRHFLQKTVRAVIEDNQELISYLCREDDVIDMRYHMIRHDLLESLATPYMQLVLDDDAHFFERVVRWLEIAHLLERVADHCAHICRRIVLLNSDQHVVFTPLRQR